MVGELKGRVILVTGASEGIGASISRKLAGLGATLVLCSRNIEKLRGFAEDQALSGSDLTLINQDLATSSGAEKCVELLLQKHGRIDAIINNVGGAIGRGVFDDLSDDNWLDTYLINVMSLVRLVRLLKPYLIKSSHGRIVTISSVVEFIDSTITSSRTSSSGWCFHSSSCPINSRPSEFNPLMDTTS